MRNGYGVLAPHRTLHKWCKRKNLIFLCLVYVNYNLPRILHVNKSAVYLRPDIWNISETYGIINSIVICVYNLLLTLYTNVYVPKWYSQWENNSFSTDESSVQIPVCPSNLSPNSGMSLMTKRQEEIRATSSDRT